MLERLESFRELIRHGNTLLGEVVSYCQQAEAAVNQLAADKQDLDRLRSELETAKTRADSEAEAARIASAQVEAQSKELGQMREELIRARSEVDAGQREQTAKAQALERSLQESRTQQKQLEEELQRVRQQPVSATRQVDLDAVRAQLRTTELLLTQARKELETERSRRNRAIAMIRPKDVEEEPTNTPARSSSSGTP